MTLFFRIPVAAALLAASMFAADSGLLTLVMPDAKVVSGISVEQSKSTPFGQYLLSQMHADQDFEKFVAATGFDPRRDLREVLVASTAEPKKHNALVLARGFFDPSKISQFAQSEGKTVTNFMGVNLISDTKNTTHAMAFVDSSLAIAGDVESVKGAIQRRDSKGSLPAALLAKVQETSAKNDAWFVSTISLAEANTSGAGITINGQIQPNMLQGITAASGGVRFGSIVLVTAEAVTRSAQDATALADVVRFMTSMAQMNEQKNPDFTAILNSLDLKTLNNTMTVSVSIPETRLEEMVRPGRNGARSKKVVLRTK